MRITDKQIMVDGDMSGNLEVIQQLEQIFGYSIEAVYAGSSPTGTLSLQASNDYNPNTQLGTWTEIANSANAITDDGSTFWNYTQSNYKYVKVVYTFGSGTGDLNVFFYGRGY